MAGTTIPPATMFAIVVRLDEQAGRNLSLFEQMEEVTDNVISRLLERIAHQSKKVEKRRFIALCFSGKC